MSNQDTDIAPFIQLKADLEHFVAPTLQIRVKDFQTASDATATAKRVKEFAKQVEMVRKTLVDPLNKRVKAINEYAKLISQPLEDAENHIKRQIGAFEDEQHKIREIELKKIEEERKQKEAELLAKQEAEREEIARSFDLHSRSKSLFGDDDASAEETHPEAQTEAIEVKQAQEQALLQAETKQREHDINQLGVKNVARVWKCAVEDIALVPREFLVVTLNDKAVLAAARAGVTKIPGVKIWQETSVRIGANSYVPKAALLRK